MTLPIVVTSAELDAEHPGWREEKARLDAIRARNAIHGRWYHVDIEDLCLEALDELISDLCALRETAALR